MGQLKSKTLSTIILGTLLTSGLTITRGEYAWFSKTTDVIAVAGQTELESQCTIEAIFMLPTSQHSGGSLFHEWVLEKEEKHLGLSFISIGATAYPNPYLEIVERTGLITLGEWHHVAFVCTGIDTRLYLNGVMVQSAPARQAIGNAEGQAFIGYAPRGGHDLPSFVGFLDSIRVSNVARYSGLSFAPPRGNLPSDGDTVLLYNFQDPSDSPTVADQSPLGRTGMLGAGFEWATAPRLIATLPSDTPLDLEVYHAVELRFATSRNVRYQVQSSPDLAVWRDLPEFIDGDGTVMSKFIPTQGTTRLFYRVVARP
jgi:hypothetical protein